MRTIQQKAKEYEEMFVSGTRQDGKSYVYLSDNASEELKESVRAAHYSKLPNDWIYGTYADLMQKITEYNLDTFDQLEDVRSEIVDSYVDIYTHDLTAWLAENIDNVNYITEIIEDGDSDDITDGFELLSRAQYNAIDEVMSEVMDLLSK